MAENNLFPIFLQTTRVNILVVGGGATGLEKTNGLLRVAPDAKLKILAEKINDELRGILQSKNIPFEERLFREEDLKDIQILILAINNKELSATITKVAHPYNILVNVADTPDLCDFYLGSVVQKGNLKIGISTNGKSPTIAKRMREFLEEVIPDEIDEMLENLHRVRHSLKGDFKEKVKQLNDLTSTFKFK